MKIGLFTDTYFPRVNGVATSVFILKEYLQKSGHQVFVFTTSDPKAVDFEPNVYRVPSLPFVSITRLAMFYHSGFAKIIRDLKLDVIHTHTEFSLGIFGKKMAKELNIPLFHTMHTIYEDYTHYLVKLNSLNSIAKSTARKMCANFCNKANVVIVPTEKVKKLLINYNVKNTITVVPTGIQLDKYSKKHYSEQEIQLLRKKIGIKESDKVLLYVGRISKEKNIEEVMHAIQNYLRERPHLKFVLVGDGPHKEKLRELAKVLKIDTQTIFVGEIPWEQVGLYYHLGDVFVSASMSETQGLTFVEALASGLPVVAKADPCLEGVVQDDVNGYVFQNATDFLEKLDALLQSDLQRKRLSLGAEKSSEKFSAEHFARAVESHYKKLISSKIPYQSHYALKLGSQEVR